MLVLRSEGVKKSMIARLPPHPAFGHLLPRGTGEKISSGSFSPVGWKALGTTFDRALLPSPGGEKVAEGRMRGWRLRSRFFHSLSG